MLPLPLSEPGPILTYLSKLRTPTKSDPTGQLADAADRALNMIRAMLKTPEGAMFLDLLEKSTQLSLTPITADERALAARNAQGFIAADLRRIASNETELLVRQQDDAASARSVLARTRPTGSRTRAGT